MEGQAQKTLLVTRIIDPVADIEEKCGRFHVGVILESVNPAFLFDHEEPVITCMDQGYRPIKVEVGEGRLQSEIGVAVIARVRVVPYTITIAVSPFGRVEGEGVRAVGVAVVIIIVVHGIGDEVAVKVRRH